MKSTHISKEVAFKGFGKTAHSQHNLFGKLHGRGVNIVTVNNLYCSATYVLCEWCADGIQAHLASSGAGAADARGPGKVALQLF